MLKQLQKDGSKTKITVGLILLKLISFIIVLETVYTHFSIV